MSTFESENIEQLTELRSANDGRGDWRSAKLLRTMGEARGVETEMRLANDANDGRSSILGEVAGGDWREERRELGTRRELGFSTIQQFN
ncbi:hypothetical protein L6452_03716 [Arctium lappa]|uniref:Uncharacterized protein n=1 Tax=Arctium lappa TaxID=4217 RepID=A0ACB9FMN2_ARCLA|nr:hypothetical protein L6452_03716 [Arctium lappa]